MRNAVTSASNCCKQMNNHPKALTVSNSKIKLFLFFNNSSHFPKLIIKYTIIEIYKFIINIYQKIFAIYRLFTIFHRYRTI